MAEADAPEPEAPEPPAPEPPARAVSRDGTTTDSVQTPVGGKARIVIDSGDGRGQRTLGIVGPEPSNVARFLAKRCGVGTAPPRPPRGKPPRKPPGGGAVRRGDERLRLAPVTLLDGTALDSVRVYDLANEDDDATPTLVELSSAEALLEACARARADARACSLVRSTVTGRGAQRPGKRPARLATETASSVGSTGLGT